LPLPLKGRLGKIAYSMANIGRTGFLQLAGAFMLFFYIDVVHLDPWLAGLVFLISYGLWNGINDPIIGSLSDRTRTRWGRRRPYMIMGIPLAFLFAILTWSPPLGGKPLTDSHSLPIFLYVLVVVAIFELGFTMVDIALDAVFPETWSDVKERSEVTVYKESFSVVGGILAMVVFPLIVDSFAKQYGTLGGWAWAGGIISAIFTGAYLFSLFGIRERKEFSLVDKPLPFITSFKTAVTNKSWITYKSADLMTTCMIDWISAVAPFFATYSLGMGIGALSIMMGVQMVAMFAFFPIWRKICIGHGTKVTLAASMITFNIGPLLGLVARDVLGIAVMGFMGGITIGGLVLARALMWADVVDEDEVKTGVRREGIYSGIGSPVDKIAYVITATGMAFLLSLIGYVSGLEPPDQLPSVNWGIRVGMAIFPLIFTAIMLVFLKFYPLGKERMDEISKKIEKMHAEKAEKLEKMAKTERA